MEPIKFGNIIKEMLITAIALAPVPISVGMFLTILNKCHKAGENIETADAMYIYQLLLSTTFISSFVILVILSP